MALTDLDPRTKDVRVEPSEDTCPTPLRDEEQPSKEDVESISRILVDNSDIFTWIIINMSGVNPSIIVQRLATYKEVE